MISLQLILYDEFVIILQFVAVIYQSCQKSKFWFNGCTL